MAVLASLRLERSGREESVQVGEARSVVLVARVGIGIGIAIGIENEAEPEVRTLGRSGLLMAGSAQLAQCDCRADKGLPGKVKELPPDMHLASALAATRRTATAKGGAERNPGSRHPMTPRPNGANGEHTHPVQCALKLSLIHI